jgi:hypothetical protein
MHLPQMDMDLCVDNWTWSRSEFYEKETELQGFLGVSNYFPHNCYVLNV